MTFGQLMAFVREKFPGNDKRNGSILKQLWKRWGVTEGGRRELEQMVRGAARLRWEDLRGLNTTEGVGRRAALKAFLAEQKRGPAAESLRSIFKGWGK